MFHIRINTCICVTFKPILWLVEITWNKQVICKFESRALSVISVSHIQTPSVCMCEAEVYVWHTHAQNRYLLTTVLKKKVKWTLHLFRQKRKLKHIEYHYRQVNYAKTNLVRELATFYPGEPFTGLVLPLYVQQITCVNWLTRDRPHRPILKAKKVNSLLQTESWINK